MKFQPEQTLRLLMLEAFVSRRLVVTLFVGTIVVTLLVGLALPTRFTAHTTILVEEGKVIGSLLEGAAPTTDVQNFARIAPEIIFGRKFMDRILAETGWLVDNPSPKAQEDIIDRLMKRTKIANPGRNLIKIEYRDEDPQRAYFTTKRYADIFIAEALAMKAAQSREAFEFLDKQTQEYHEKLLKAEDDLKEFRSSNLDTHSRGDGDIGTRLGTLQANIEDATQQLREWEVRKQSLDRQLSGEAEIASVVSRESQYRARIGELQSQIETLRLSYTDDYPDIRHLRHQIEDLNRAIAEERAKREQAKSSGHVVIDDTIVNNPMYQQLKREASAAQIEIDTRRARIAEAKRQLAQELDRGKRAQGGEATLAELTRDYNVNRQFHETLLKRREAARMSMNVDSANQGASFKIQEPAVLPLKPSGLRLWHMLFAGIVFGLALPAGLLYARIQLDPRIRLSALISQRHKVPVLTTVPRLWSPAETAAVRADIQQLLLVVSATFVAIALFVVLRLTKVI